MRRTAALLLIAIGSFLEIFYYSWRFEQDGAPWALAVVIGLGLTLFLSVLTLLRTHKAALVIAAFLISYSIVATTAGQMFALGTVQRSESAVEAERERTAERVDYYRDQIDALNSEYRANQEKLAQADIEGLAMWRTNAVEPIRERQRRIESRISDYESRIAELTDELDAYRAPQMDIYRLIEREAGIDAFTVQVILQAALATFIAMMAPSGIILATQHRRKPEVSEQQIDVWVDISYAGLRTGKADHLYSKDAVLHVDKQRRGALDSESYDKVLSLAKRRKVARERDGRLLPLVEDPAHAKNILRRT